MQKNFTRLNAAMIERNLINLPQLTFEVTDACNLHCKYCGYGDIYEGYDTRESKYLTMKKAIVILEYMIEKWSSKYSASYQKETYISFYGGEPLLNMKFIREAVEWISNKETPHCHFAFTMTTNGILLKEHIDFLKEHDFHILVSLDGNRENNSYRIDKHGNNSFDKIINNLTWIQEKYPVFFEKNIRFNAVLHNRNSYDSIVRFFKEKFNILPSIAELNPMNIKPDYIHEFSELYNTRMDSISQSANEEELQRELFMDNPQTKSLCTYIHWHSGNVFKSYNDLLSNEKNKKWIPTGTCLPFERKMFVTVNGKILSCERISQEYALGRIEENKVLLNTEEIAIKYNEWYEQYIPQCTACYAVHTCQQCMFYNPHLNDTAECPYFMDQSAFEKYKAINYAYLATHPYLYRKIMEEVIIH